MKSCCLLLAAALCAMAAPGCTFVTSSAPVGTEIYKIENPDQLEGTWVAEKAKGRKNELLDETRYQVTVVEPENGLLRIGFIPDPASDDKKTEYMEVHLRSANGRIIASAFDVTEGGYLWSPLTFTPETVTLSMPDGEKFEEAIKAGELPGRDAHLENLSDENLKYILRDNFKTLFFKDGDIVFRREKNSPSKGKNK